MTPDLEAVTADAVAGDVAAAGALYGALSPAVCGYLTVRGAEDPEGLTNEVFLTVLPLLPTLKGGWEGLRTLAFTVAHARLVDDQRRRERRRTTPYVVDSDRRTGESAESQAMARLGHDELLSVIGLLPADQQSVVVLRVLADLSVRQTAVAMGRSVSAVERLQAKALAALRRLLTVGADPEVLTQAAGEPR